MSSICKAPGCKRGVLQRELCQMHYTRMRRHGSYDLPEPPPLVNAGTCSYLDCDKPASARGMCRKHYVRYNRHGSPDAYLPTRKPTVVHSGGGYILEYRPGHPLADSEGYVYQHRGVYFENGEPLVCHVCGVEHEGWETVHIDHLDDDPKNNHIDNLKPACPRCNQARGIDKMKATQRANGVQVTWNGQTKCLTEWAEGMGISRTSLAIRLKRWSLERAMTEPRGKFGPKARSAKT